MDNRIFIINELKRVADSIAPEPIRRRDFRAQSEVPLSQIRKYFGTWKAALNAAGVEFVPSMIKRLSDEELMDAVGELWRNVGKRPTYDDMTYKGRYSVTPYMKRWGSYSKAIEHYIRLHGTPHISTNSSLDYNVTPVSRQPRGRVSLASGVSIHKPKSPGNRTRKSLLGEIIDFRGLRHAPVNEQGVVYLFGMVSRELGFLIESVRTAYPDCEGIRQLDGEGTRWQRVRIEFEYKSSNFKEHGHDPEYCDLIVCWIHDWQDAPIEVLELRKAVRSLSGVT